MPILAADFCPNNARAVDDSRINVGTWNVAKQSDWELDDSHRHSFVFRVRAPHDDQHTADLRSRMDKYG